MSDEHRLNPFDIFGKFFDVKFFILENTTNATVGDL